MDQFRCSIEIIVFFIFQIKNAVASRFSLRILQLNAFSHSILIWKCSIRVFFFFQKILQFILSGQSFHVISKDSYKICLGVQLIIDECARNFNVRRSHLISAKALYKFEEKNEYFIFQFVRQKMFKHWLTGLRRFKTQQSSANVWWIWLIFASMLKVILKE